MMYDRGGSGGDDRNDDDNDYDYDDYHPLAKKFIPPGLVQEPTILLQSLDLCFE